MHGILTSHTETHKIYFRGIKLEYNPENPMNTYYIKIKDNCVLECLQD